MGYSLSRKAEEDILGIYIDGIQRFSLVQADRTHRQLEEVFEFLADNPRVARERTEITPPVWMHPFRAHLVVSLVDEREQVLIARVRHGHEDRQGASGPQSTKPCEQPIDGPVSTMESSPRESSADDAN